MSRSSTSVARAVLFFALAGVVVLIVIGVAGVVALRRLGDAEALRRAQQLAVVTGEAVVQPRLSDELMKGGAKSRLALAEIEAPVLRDPLVHMRIWDLDGKVVYADAPELIGQRFDLAPTAARAAQTGEPAAGTVDLSLPQNRSQQDLGPLLEVVVPLETPEGHELLFEASLLANSVRSSGQQLWSTFLPVMAVALLAFALLEIPLAYRLARQVRESQREREVLLQRAIEASDRERRRITSDLHDGLVQELAGLSMSLAASADKTEGRDPEAAEILRDAADTTRQGMRSLRSAVMGIFPPNVQRTGLASALSDLAAPAEARGIEVVVDVPTNLDLPADVESLLFQCAQESMRNVVTHAKAESVDLRVAVNGRKVVMEIDDDGVGFSADDHAEARSEGHLGLHILEDLIRDARGTFSVTSEPGTGTRIRLEVPLR